MRRKTWEILNVKGELRCYCMSEFSTFNTLALQGPKEMSVGNDHCDNATSSPTCGHEVLP